VSAPYLDGVVSREACLAAVAGLELEPERAEAVGDMLYDALIAITAVDRKLLRDVEPETLFAASRWPAP
jgi:hypothetical protein